MIKKLIIILAVVAAVGGLMVALVLKVMDDNARWAEQDRLCHPYSVLTSYRLDDEHYVVCGNKEHKLVVLPE